MGMDHLCVRLINDGISRLDHTCRIDHIFIKNRVPDKSALFFKNLPVISTADIGAEIGLDSHGS